MAKSSGLGDNFYVGGFDLSGDTQSLKISGGHTPLDVTGINKSAHERLGGIRTGQIDIVEFFNKAVGQEHPVLSALPTTDVDLMYMRGTAVGNPVAAMRSKQINYDPTRANDGMLTIAVSGQSNGFGLEWGTQLTAGIRTDTAATNGSVFDNTVAGTNGCQVYIQVFSRTVTDCTITIQSSAASNMSSPQTEATYLTTAANTTTRIVGSNSSVNRYWRAITTTSGGITSISFAVAVMINPIATVF